MADLLPAAGLAVDLMLDSFDLLPIQPLWPRELPLSPAVCGNRDVSTALSPSANEPAGANDNSSREQECAADW